jgi:anti-anti-sigma factor
MPELQSTAPGSSAAMTSSRPVFEIRPQREGGRFKLVGELDLSSTEALLDEVRQVAEEDTDIVLDLRDLTFVDSTGVRSFVTISNRLRSGSLTLEGPRSNVARVLRLVGAEAFPHVRIVWVD